MKKTNTKAVNADQTVEEQVDPRLVQAVQLGEEWKGKYLRVLADYQNLDKRTQAEKQEIRMYAAEIVLGRLLPAMDTLTRATTHLEDMGLTLALKELYAVLAEQGVKKMDVVGKQFNPHEMECIEVVTGPENEVMEEVLPGYLFHNKVLRVAQVKVGRKEISKSANDKYANEGNID